MPLLKFFHFGAIIYNSGRQTLSVKSHAGSVLGFAAPTISVTTTHPAVEQEAGMGNTEDEDLWLRSSETLVTKAGGRSDVVHEWKFTNPSL